MLPKSVTPERIIGESAVQSICDDLWDLYNHVKPANLKVVDLTEEEIAELKEINKTIQFRACPPEWAGWGNLGFTDNK